MRYTPVISYICSAALIGPIILAQNAWAANQTASVQTPNTKTPNTQTPNILTPYTLTPQQLATLDTNEPVLDVWAGADDSRMVEVYGVIDITASPQHIWAIMKDCELQKLIIKDMKRCEITAQSPDDNSDGNWDERTQTVSISAFLPRVKSKFRSDYIPYREMKVTRTGGDLSHLDGVWHLNQTQDGQTRVSYRARLKPKLPVPRKLMRKATAKDMPIVLRNLRDLAQEHQALADAHPNTVIRP